MLSLGLLVVGVLRLHEQRVPRTTVVAPVPAVQPVPVERGSGAVCADLTEIPAGTRRLTAAASVDSAGQRVRGYVRAADGSRLRAPSVRVSSTGEIALRLDRPLRADLVDARACLVPLRPARVDVLGTGSAPTLTLSADGTTSKLAALPTVLTRLGVARPTAITTPLIALALALLVGAAVAAPLLLVALWGGAGPRRVVLALAGVAVLSAGTWSVVSPPFQHPDEGPHLSYADVLGQTGLPPSGAEPPPPEGARPSAVDAAQGTLAVGAVAGTAGLKPPWTDADDERVDRDLGGATGPARDVATNVTPQPPGFYAPVALAGRVLGVGPLDRLMVGRLLSVLLFGVTIAATFVFVRELHAGAAWVAIPAALSLALYPVFAYSSASVNPDSLFFAASAVLLAAFARVIRRGWTTRRSLLVAAAAVALVASKLTALALVPGFLLLGLVAVAAPGGRTGAANAGGLVSRVKAIAGQSRPALPGAVLLLVGLVAYGAYLAVSGRGPFGPTAVSATAQAGAALGGEASINVRGTLSFIWQSFLPRLPFQQDLVPGSGPLEVWRPALTGAFGYVDHGFGAPMQQFLGRFWVTIALGATLLAAILVWRRRGSWRRLAEGAAYALVAAGLFYAVGQASYLARTQGLLTFEQARYLFPILPLVAVWIACAFRVPRGLGPALALLCVAVSSLHALAALEIVISRYYL